jgi:nucleoside-diphosphate-sugar epimerase
MRRLMVGCGYLGDRVARLWCEAGDTVYATTRGGRAEMLSRSGLRPLTLDVTDVPTAAALPTVDTVVFAVGRDRQTGVTMRDIHLTGLRAVLEALPPATGRVIYVSSSGVYGQDSGEWVDEESACEPLSAGGRACLSGERLLSTHPRGRDAVVLRLAGLYGPGRAPYATHVRSTIPIAGSRDAFLNLVHVDDAAAAVVAAAACGGGRIYAASDGHPPTRGDYVEWLAARLRMPAPPFEGGTGLGKRVRNSRVLCELVERLTYPSYRDGLDAMRD